MQEIFNVIEYGHRTTFLNQQTRGGDAYHLLSWAVRSVSGNGGNLTAALAEVQNISKYYQELSPQAHPLQRLDAEEAEEYDQDFQSGHGVESRVTIDLDRGVMITEHGPSICGANTMQDGEQPIPEEILGPLKQAREAPAIRLRDLVLLGLPPVDVYLVGNQYDVGTIPASGLRKLTDRGRAKFADLLNAKVETIQPGAYGVELVMAGILPERLADFDWAQAAMLRASPYLGMFQAADQGGSAAVACPEEAVRAVRDYLCFERDTTQLWPWFLSAEEMLGDEQKLREIGAALHPDPEHGYGTEEIHQALTETFGVNPALEQGQTMGL